MRQESLIRKNIPSLIIITSLYILQGIPQGFVNLMKLTLLTTNSSYLDVAFFSATYYPYSFKILWSPLVDAIFSTRIGRRRSWIIPMQFMMASVFLLLGSSYFLPHDLTETPSLITWLVQKNHIPLLTLFFFILFFSTATQDIALDAWALGLLPAPLRDLSSTCQTAGLTIGNLLGFNIVLTFTSKQAKEAILWPTWLNDYLPLDIGFFCLLFGGTVVIANLIVMMIPEDPLNLKEKGRVYSVRGAYRSILSMLGKTEIRSLVVVILTSVFPFGPNMFLLDSLAITRGIVKKETLAMVDLFSVPFSLMMTKVFTSREERRFLKSWLDFFMVKLGVTAIISLFMQNSSLVKDNEIITWSFYFFYVVFSSLDKVLFILYFAFCSKICDETYGGTYMTFLAVVYNFGHVWVSNCIFGVFDSLNGVLEGGMFDGYSFLSIVCFGYGVIWVMLMGEKVRKLDEIEEKNWKLAGNSKNK